jgi:hypothetical protein
MDTNECIQCHKPMTPIDWMLGPVCLACCKDNHADVVYGGKDD